MNIHHAVASIGAALLVGMAVGFKDGGGEARAARAAVKVTVTGRVVVQGSPETIARKPGKSHTAKILGEFLGQRGVA